MTYSLMQFVITIIIFGFTIVQLIQPEYNRRKYHTLRTQKFYIRRILSSSTLSIVSIILMIDIIWSFITTFLVITSIMVALGFLWVGFLSGIDNVYNVMVDTNFLTLGLTIAYTEASGQVVLLFLNWPLIILGFRYLLKFAKIGK